MSPNSQKGKAPASQATPANDNAGDISMSSTSLPARTAQSATALARDVFSKPSPDVSASLASLTNGKAAAGPSASSASASASAADVASSSGTRATAESAARFRTSRNNASSELAKNFDAFIEDGELNGADISAFEPAHTAPEQLQAQMQALHESWRREWSRHPSDIESGHGGASAASGGGEVGGSGSGYDVLAVQARDGADVVALLGLDDDDDDDVVGGQGEAVVEQRRKPFYAQQDLQTELDDAKDVSADDLFPGSSSGFTDTSTTTSSGDAAISTRTVHGGTNLDTLRNPTYDFLPEAGFQDEEATWLHDWERVLTSYTDDVWDPSSFPWVVEAREMLQEVKEERKEVSIGSMGGGRARALERLRMVVGHIRLPDGSGLGSVG